VTIDVSAGQPHAALIVLGGLPGTGKTTIARALAAVTGAVHLRIDSIEAALRAGGVENIADMGYRVAYAIAEDNLRLGRRVIADSVNPLTITREAWRQVAARTGVEAIEVEITCSSTNEHRRRIETRVNDIAGRPLTWEDVLSREYDVWNDGPHLVVDTSQDDLTRSLNRIRELIERFADS